MRKENGPLSIWNLPNRTSQEAGAGGGDGDYEKRTDAGLASAAADEC